MMDIALQPFADFVEPPERMLKIFEESHPNTLTSQDHPATTGGGEPGHGIVPPFAATCRASSFSGSPQYSYCLVDPSIHCFYRGCLPGFGSSCLHPRHMEIVARTPGKIAALK
jgi:hypothetical protein